MFHKKHLIQYIRAIAVVAALATTAACSTLHVRTDYNHTTDFEHYHTYSWLRVSAGNSLWVNRIKTDVNAQLAMKGWQQVPSGGEATVAAFGATHEIPTLQTSYNGFGPGLGGWRWGGFYGEGYASTQVVYTPMGSLVVDVFNAHTKSLIWRGVARQAITANPETNEQKLARAVAKMFDNFPPPSRG